MLIFLKITKIKSDLYQQLKNYFMGPTNSWLVGTGQKIQPKKGGKCAVPNLRLFYKKKKNCLSQILEYITRTQKKKFVLKVRLYYTN